MLPPARLDVHLFPRQVDDVDQKALGQPVLAHDAGGECPPGLAQGELTVVGYVKQAVSLHPGHRLADRRARLGQALGDPGPKRDDALLFKLEDRAKVHLRRVDKPMGSHSNPPPKLMLRASATSLRKAAFPYGDKRSISQLVPARL